MVIFTSHLVLLSQSQMIFLAAICDGFLGTNNDDKLACTSALGKTGAIAATIGTAAIGDGRAVSIFLQH